MWLAKNQKNLDGSRLEIAALKVSQLEQLVASDQALKTSWYVIF